MTIKKYSNEYIIQQNTQLTLFDGDNITDDDLNHISANFQRLKYLYIKSSKITNTGLSTLYQLTNLTHLQIHSKLITFSGLIPLVILKHLTYLDIDSLGGESSTRGMQIIGDFKYLTFLKLNCINLNTYFYDDTGYIIYIDNSIFTYISKLKNLESLEIINTCQADISYLKDLPKLTKLSFHHIDDSSLFYISTQFKTLVDLVLIDNNITITGINHFKNFTNLKNVLLVPCKLFTTEEKSMLNSLPILFKIVYPLL